MHTSRPGPKNAITAALALVAAAVLTGCGPEDGRRIHSGTRQAGFEPTPTRGYIVLSIDTLRADRLGAYGYGGGTTPFLDRLAARGAVFEREIVQFPGTLPSHMSIFTGLYPREHGVFPPAASLSPRVPTLPEIFRAAGFRTGGFTEGGYMKGYYGFSRGFEDWGDPDVQADTDVEKTLASGLQFLRRLGPRERFFLFLHTFSVHDPYDPPERYRRMFWPGPPPAGAFAPTGPELTRVSERGPDPSPEVVAYLSALYDASIRYVDDVLARFFADLEKSGLLAETTVVITSDHGEEFFEHRRLAHTQTYDETLHVPLLVLHPAQKGPSRVAALVESLDIAPTLLELAGIAAPPMSGRSFVRALRSPAVELRSEAFAEGESWIGGVGKALYRSRGDELLQLVFTRPLADPDGVWVSHELRFDTVATRLDFDAVSFATGRQLRVMLDGSPRPSIPLDTGWRRVSMTFDEPGQKRISLQADGCDSPLELGTGSDSRCLAFKLRGIPVSRLELFELQSDPLGLRDLSHSRPTDARALHLAMSKIRHSPRAAADQLRLEEEQIRALRALGYLR